METVSQALTWLNGIVWGVPMLVLILGIGVYLTVGLRLRSVLRLPLSLAFLWRGRAAEEKGEISPYTQVSPHGSTQQLWAWLRTWRNAGLALSRNYAVCRRVRRANAISA